MVAYQKETEKLQEGLKNSLPVFLGGLGGSGGHELKNFFNLLIVRLKRAYGA